MRGMRRIAVVLAVLAVLLALLALWPSSDETAGREPVPAAAASADSSDETGSRRTEAPVSPRAEPGAQPAGLSLAEAVRALAARRPEALDFARAELDLELARELKALVRERRATAAELVAVLDALDLQDPARAACVLALAWAEGERELALERLVAVAATSGTDSVNLEQCALAAVRALGLAGARESLARLVADEVAPGGELEQGLHSVRVWLALRELARLPDVVAEALLAGTERELPRRVLEEAWAAAARSGEAPWIDVLWRAVEGGDEAALAGLAQVRDAALEPAVLDLHARASGWTLIAAQKSLATLATDSSLAALEADLLLPVRRDGALEALRAWRADCERMPELAALDALLALHARLAQDADAHAALASAFEREAALLALRAAARADDAAVAALLRAAASARD